MSIKNVAICTSCGQRIEYPYWHDDKPYCYIDYTVQTDYDRADIIEDGYQGFHNLFKLFVS